jgi:hypothetical protein
MPKKKEKQAAEQIFGIECNDLTGYKDVEIHGPFKSVIALKRALLDCETPDVKSCQLEEGENEDYSSDILIVKVLETVKVVPVVDVSLMLRPSEHPDEPEPRAS